MKFITLSLILAFFLSFSLILVGANISHSFDHEKLIEEYKPIFVDSTQSEVERNLQERKPRHMIITYTLVGFEKLPEEESYFRDQIRNSINVAVKFFHDLIMIIPKGKYSRYQEEQYITDKSLWCYMAEITPEEQRVERDTDLHFYVTYDHNENSGAAASAIDCRNVKGLGPTHGGININKAHFRNKDLDCGHKLEDTTEIIIHEMLHVLGFSGHQISSYWVDSNKQHYQNHVVYQQWRGQMTAFLRTPNVLNFAQKYFGCNNIPGVPIQIKTNADQKQFSPGSHWKYFTTWNELMNPVVVDTQALFTEFTANLLRDTGYYHSINHQMVESSTFGKDAGCNFFYGDCNAKRYPEFCDSKDEYQCDFFHQGRSYCGNSECNVAQILPEYRCYDERSESNTRQSRAKYGTKFGVNTRCFNSSLVKFKYAQKDREETVKGQCYKFECNEANQVTVNIGPSTVTCSRNNEELSVNGYLGVLKCPENLENFCNQKKFCPKACLGKGYCLNGQCHCIKGWTGRTCGVRNPWD